MPRKEATAMSPSRFAVALAVLPALASPALAGQPTPERWATFQRVDQPSHPVHPPAFPAGPRGSTDSAPGDGPLADPPRAKPDNRNRTGEAVVGGVLGALAGVVLLSAAEVEEDGWKWVGAGVGGALGAAGVGIGSGPAEERPSDRAAEALTEPSRRR